MNIMLTDLPLPGVDAQEVSAVVDSGAQSFAGMFHQQFPDAATVESQAVEFKEFFENVPLEVEHSAVTLEAFSMPAGREPSAQIMVAANPLSAVLPDHVDSPATPHDLASGVNVGVGIPIEVGELLPIGGNQLPQKVSPDTPVAGVPENSLQAPMAAVVTPPGLKAAGVEAIQNSLPPTIQAQSSAVPPGAVKTDRVNPDTSTVSAMAAKATGSMDVAPPKEQAASPESVLALAREAPVKAGIVTGNESSREAESIRRMVDASEVLPSRPEIALRSAMQPAVVPVMTGYEFKPEQLPQIASSMASNTKQVAAPDILPAREVLADGQLLRRDNMLAGETVPAREVSGNIELRGLEMPVQASTNTANQAVLTTASNMHAAPVTGTVNTVPATVQNPLPPQLESMNLTRSADSTEWGNGLSERVNWMINQKQNSATIRIDPPTLGKLDVQIKIVDDTTTISIQTQTGQTRDLIEAASTRLRDFLQESGYQNVNVDVSQRQDQQQARAQTAASTNPEQDDADGQEQGADQQQNASYFSGDGLVDTFA